MGIGLSRPASDTQGDFDQPAIAAPTHESKVADQQLSPLASWQAYPLSWVDRLTDWVRRLTISPWAFYLTLGLVLWLVLLLSEWAGGAPPSAGLVPDYLLTGMTCAYVLAMVHFLDDSSKAALARFRPVITVDDDGYNKLYYKLTNLPARPTMLATALGAFYSLATLLLSIYIDGTSGLAAVPSFLLAVDLVFRTLIYGLLGMVIYHTLHQLRTVNEIYTRYTRINLFHLGPIYALSSLAARTAIGIAIPTYAWFQLASLSAVGNSPSDIFETIILAFIGIATFIWPLLGAHSLLEREKQRLKDEVAQRIEATIASLHGSVDTAALENRGPLKDTLEGLVAEQGVVDKLRTWPWRTETVSGLGFAFLLPILIWVVQRILERLGI